jgi:hypothetical protein
MTAYAFDRSTPVSLRLRMHRGVADITAEERPDIQVEVNALDSSGSAEEAAAGYQVVLDGDELLIQAPEGSGWLLRRSPKIHVVARIPAGSALSARMAAADLRARGDYGVVQADLASGDGYVERVAGDCQLKSASGDVQADLIGGSLRISTASGDLRIGDVNGDVNAGTASGDMTIQRIGGSLQAKTASGDIEIGRLRQGTASISSASGDVTAGVAAGTGVWLDLNTASGDTTSDLTQNDAAAAAGQTAALQLRVRTASGDIHIHRTLGDTERETV